MGIAASPSSSRSSSMAPDPEGDEGSPSKAGSSLDAAELGAPDCTLVGSQWSIPAHRQAHPLPFLPLGTLCLVYGFSGIMPAY